jgi:hypothetical protein
MLTAGQPPSGTKENEGLLHWPSRCEPCVDTLSELYSENPEFNPCKRSRGGDRMTSFSESVHKWKRTLINATEAARHAGDR